MGLIKGDTRSLDNGSCDDDDDDDGAVTAVAVAIRMWMRRCG